ncbi:MAG: alcohol dehydrogenase catalytic domain-containing protein [Clostridiales bacterium]|nr:alcohol dehydrogenase catalytic domain-containing protein [Clostridiales bacterium]
MKALYYLGNKTLELREVPDPTPRENEYLIKIEACGICGSDYEGYLGKTNRRIAPMIMGHEAAGVVAWAPAGGRYPLGTNVVVFPNFFCGDCDICQSGMTNNCVNGSFLGILTYNGCMTQYVTVPEKFLIPFADSLSLEEAAMVEPLAVAMDAVCKVSGDEINRSEYTIIVGGGTIGLLVLMMLRQRKAGYVIMSDTFDFRLDLAKKLGADATINPLKENFNEAVKQYTKGKMCNLAFEAVGFSATAQSSLEALRPGGLATWVGNAQKMIEVDMQRIVVTELRIQGTHIYTFDEFRRCLALLTDGTLNVSPLITDRYRLEDGVEAFRALEENTDGTKLKIMLRP